MIESFQRIPAFAPERNGAERRLLSPSNFRGGSTSRPLVSFSKRADLDYNWTMPERCNFQADKLLVRLDITLHAEVSAISPIVDSVMDTAREMGCGQGHEAEIELAIREALANAITHGCGGDSSKQVRCCVACDETRGMLIIVSDPGRGFDPANVPSPLIGEQLYSEHGRGLYLINQLMDQVWFSNGGAQIHMIKSSKE